MRKPISLLLLVVLALSTVTAGAGTISIPYTFSPNTTIESAKVNSDFSTMYNEFNGNISDANIASISESKITFTGTGHAHAGGSGGAPIQLVSGTSITSASSITVPTDGNYFTVTGTTTITAIGSRNTGVLAVLRFTGQLLLTHNATSLILPGAANISTSAGDTAVMVSEGSGNWRCLAYQRVTAGSGQAGAYASRNLVGVNNTGTPNTQYDVSADLAQLRNPTDGSIFVKASTGTITNNVSTAGPAANGRDAAGAFSASSWVHFYWIASGTTLATVSSATAPPTGPTLPTGYTHWGYIGAVRFDASSHLIKTRIQGAVATITPVVVRAVAAGSSGEQSFDMSANIPPNHRGAWIHITTNRTDLAADIRVATGGDVVLTANYTGSSISGSASGLVPLDSQTVYVVTGAAGSVGVLLNAYKMPNGGE